MKEHATFVIILVCLACMPGVAQDAHTGSVLQSLVNTERAFASTCAEKGIRASFLQFFADSGVTFFPEPVKYKAAVMSRPAPANPLAISLEWEPQVGGVATSGDLGFTTGPSIRTDNTAKGKPKHYGQFFSVWKKEKDGAWKVAVDIGTSTPIPASTLGLPFKEISLGRSAAVTSRTAETDRWENLRQLEEEFSKSCASDGLLSGYLLRSTDVTRLHREDRLPVVGTDAIRAFLGTQTLEPTWHPLVGEISKADDLGYTYGSYEFAFASGDLRKTENGYYLHVWMRNRQGDWKLVADITNPLPAEGQQ